jgi:hypothetical protein
MALSKGDWPLVGDKLAVLEARLRIAEDDDSWIDTLLEHAAQPDSSHEFGCGCRRCSCPKTCVLCGQPLNGETIAHDRCAAYESFLSDSPERYCTKGD